MYIAAQQCDKKRPADFLVAPGTQKGTFATQEAATMRTFNHTPSESRLRRAAARCVLTAY